MHLKQIFRKPVFALFTVLLVVFSLLLPLIPQTALAADTGLFWTNISTIHAVPDYKAGDKVLSGKITITQGIIDGLKGDYKFAGLLPIGQSGDPEVTIGVNGAQMNMIYTLSGGLPGEVCDGFISVPAGPESGRTVFPSTNQLTWKQVFDDPLKPNSCDILRIKGLNGHNADNRDIWFNWVNSTSIEPTGKLPIMKNIADNNGISPQALQYSTFTKDPNGNNQYKGDLAEPNSKCFSFLQVHDDQDWLDTFLYRGNNSNGNNCTPLSASNGNYAAKTVRIGNKDCKAEGSNCQPTAPAASGLSGNDPDFACHSEIPVLGWFICSIIEGLHTASKSLNDAIICHLQLPVNQLFDNGTGNSPPPTVPQGVQCNFNSTASTASTANKELWSTFRYISLGLLVLVALIMVFAQAIGSTAIDAYTVKKVLPRLIAAAILITLSWELGRFFVQLSNDLATGVRQVLQSVSPPGIELNLNAATSGLTSVGVIAGGAALGLLGWVSALTMLLTVLLAVAVAFLIIIFRELIIVFCVITAPIAFVAFILPNTQKVWKLWKDTFQGALLIFPMIVGFIYLGRLLAAIESKQAGDDPISNIAVMALYFGPYFLIPATLKFTTGLLSTLGGMVNDRSKGVFDRLSKSRRDNAAKRIKGHREGGFYNKTGTRRARFGNALGTYVFNADEKIPHALGERGVPGMRGAFTKYQAKIDKAKLEQTFEGVKAANEASMNDQGGRVISGAFLDPNDEAFSNPIRQQLIKRFYETDKDGNAIAGTFKGIKTEKDWDDASAILGSSEASVAEQHGAQALQAFKGTALNFARDGKGYTDLESVGGLIVASHGFMTETDLNTVGKNVLASSGGNKAYANRMLTQMEVNGKNSGLKVTYSHAWDEDGNLITGEAAGRGWDRAQSKSYQEIFSQKKHAAQSDVNELVDIIKTSKMSEPELAVKVQEWQDAGFSQDVIKSRLANLQEKAAVAAGTLQSGLQWSPGASDSGIVALNAKKELVEFGFTEGELDTLASRGKGYREQVTRSDDDDNPTIHNPPPSGGGPNPLAGSGLPGGPTANPGNPF